MVIRTSSVPPMSSTNSIKSNRIGITFPEIVLMFNFSPFSKLFCNLMKMKLIPCTSMKKRFILINNPFTRAEIIPRIAFSILRSPSLFRIKLKSSNGWDSKLLSWTNGLFLAISASKIPAAEMILVLDEFLISWNSCLSPPSLANAKN